MAFPLPSQGPEQGGMRAYSRLAAQPAEIRLLTSFFIHAEEKGENNARYEVCEIYEGELTVFVIMSAAFDDESMRHLSFVRLPTSHIIMPVESSTTI